MDFRGASADAFAAVSTELSSVAAGGAEAARVADDLFTVSRLLRTEAQLRRIVTDVSVPTAAKQGLVREIFASKVSEGSMKVLDTAVSRRWTRPRDLADALERLSEVAVVTSADDASGLSDEVFAVAELVRSNPDLRDALADPARSTDDKVGLVDGLLGDKVSAATVTLVKQAVRGSYRTIAVALQAYRQVAAEVHGRSVATVRVAQPLGEDDRSRLTAALSAQYDRPVHLDVLVDPSVIGGLRVEIGHEVVDGTVAGRLDEARRQLAG